MYIDLSLCIQLVPLGIFISVQVVAILVVKLRVEILRHVVHLDDRTRKIVEYFLIDISIIFVEQS